MTQFRYFLILLFLLIFGFAANDAPTYAGETNATDAPGKCAAAGARDAYLSGYLPVEGPKPVSTAVFRGASNTTHSIVNWRGRALILNFWATWCPPCVKELPALNRLKLALEGVGVDVVVINEDKASASAVAGFLAKVGAADLKPYWDPDRTFMKAARVASLPTTLLIDKNGHEIAAVLREADWSDPAIVAFITGCLAGEPSPPSSGLKTNGSP